MSCRLSRAMIKKSSKVKSRAQLKRVAKAEVRKTPSILPSRTLPYLYLYIIRLLTLTPMATEGERGQHVSASIRNLLIPLMLP